MPNPTRKHLPPEERREQIIDAAIEVFSEKGFDGTSNKEVAKLAGIASPGLIYHYFADKLELLRESLLSRMPHPPEIVFDPDRPLKEVLYEITGHVLQDLNNPRTVKLMRVLLGEALRRPEFARLMTETMENRVFTRLEEIFKAHIAQGTLRSDLDPTVTTMRFMGALFQVFFAREVMRFPSVMMLDLDKVRYQLVDDFLQGTLAPAH
ncbi:TetR/AcrR family transcriptional regulator [Armatimonas sp.]|uniref:TetR/AcrR family transcriptional regulator n=1 Tax=Armatimonas sp. TaxID=1872638 RepID=UPI00286A6C68|nr:TetR/AcrR family transcriptional regulator [Armatimonas sp.]